MPGQSPRNRTVYVIKLDPTVMNKRRFSGENPQYVQGKPCVYVGMTVRSPQERYGQHKADERSNKYVRAYGERILAEECVSGLTYSEAQKEEVRVAETLRQRGWAAWQK